MRDPNDLPFPPPESGTVSGVHAHVGVPSDMLSSFGGKRPGGSSKVPYVAAVIVAVGGVLGFRHLTAKPDPGTAILVTNPADVGLSVDGSAVALKSTPIKLEGLAPEVDHSIEISTEGFKPATQRFKLVEGEVKLLPAVALEALKVDTGFTLDSNPTGATVLLDGAKLGVTPVHLTTLEPGKHVIRVENGLTHAPWEGPIDAIKGEVLALPTVELVALSPRDVKKAERAAKAAAKAAAATHAAN
jgi:hypothetical protein